MTTPAPYPNAPWPALAVLRWWAGFARATAPLLPAGVLVAASPFHWAPPLWVGAFMAGGGAGPAAPAGAPASRSEPAPAPEPVPAPLPPPAPARRRRRASD
ncbi:hypothetical protein [Azospirillum halopraeferens]|uniref:hypothetical protein n=1 Tax=Azospirillum halopraeferens TaxID=34010 RepID=UPI00042132BB|nr:hypothetical protein [Azospirillum halopraeferens]